jgi:hypothetical protein
VTTGNERVRFNDLYRRSLLSPSKTIILVANVSIVPEEVWRMGFLVVAKLRIEWR